MSTQWLSLVATIWLQSISGTNTNFPAYSSQLKHLLNMSQLQLNNLAFASDAGKILAWFSGVAAAHLPLWLVLMIGSLIGMIGYGVQYFLLTNLHVQSSTSYWLVFLLTVVAGNSICWINTVCYILTIRSFPLDMQLALGLSTSYQGLSAKIYADIVDVVYTKFSSDGKARGYLLLNSVLPLIVCIIVAPVVARSSNVGDSISSGGGSCSRKLSSGFVVMFLITIVTGTYAVISSCLGDSILWSSRFSQLFILTGMSLLVIVFPLLVPMVEKIRESVQHKCWIRQRKVCSFPTDEHVNEAPPALENGIVKKSGEFSDVIAEEEIGPKLMLKKVDFWLYFFVYLFGATLGLVYLNNLGQVVESRGHSRTTTLVSLSSSFCFFGRLVPSLLEYHFTRTKYMGSRAGTMAMMMAPMSGAFFILLINSNIALYISTAIISLSTGAISTISVSATRELFGAKDFGINHNILIINIPIGSFIFGNAAAVLYRRNSDGSDVGKCMGMTCYQTSFMIWGSLCCLGTLLALILHSRTKKL
ncbi:protein NUCLEAR FUSION DEFECTIVE 4 [Heracleum sosnowskyi]|uniref:Protein NUCLEAR FUSION DEFECTIVE 4 n=1 Tax=Heracleum sosnowskyi TaxID=360622 RepID=A0AAD8M788_9APIA|nr:protein NUCLEAR FUSION DEFECTIVE 4 [Heracleum sosnowskyi]